MFTDKVEIEVQAGRGGDGKISFRHEKFKAKGGPDGGDGGHGGDIIFEVDHNLNTLGQFRRQRQVRADSGQAGGSNRRHGKSGERSIVRVPPGTQVWQDGRLIADLTVANQDQVVARGGRGGFGNAHFAASTRQIPRLAELGEPGEAKRLTLELKLLADVGLIGLPNAGKSTLLAVISNARPEVADYPFTTLVPNLGLVEFDGASFVAADIPGLIEGASLGKGLGDEFLRHVERTAVIVHLIDAASPDVTRDMKIIDTELKSYNKLLTKKPQVAVLSKTDTVPPEQAQANFKALKRATRRPVFAISAVAHEGLNELLGTVMSNVLKARVKRAEEPETVPVIDVASRPELWLVERHRGYYEVKGGKIESFAARTNFDSDESVIRLRDIMRRMGVARELKRQGAREGAKIRIGHKELEW